MTAAVGNWQPVRLTHNQARVLSALMRQPGETMGRMALLRLLYDGAGMPSQERNVDQTVARLRRRMGAAGQRIETVRKLGYCWKAEAVWR